jgi:hypothetical protein
MQFPVSAILQQSNESSNKQSSKWTQERPNVMERSSSGRRFDVHSQQEGDETVLQMWRGCHTTEKEGGSAEVSALDLASFNPGKIHVI